MNILLLKLILSPLIIGSASLAGRKWGHAVSGWIIGLPLTSGPIMFFLSLTHPKSFVIWCHPFRVPFIAAPLSQ